MERLTEKHYGGKGYYMTCSGVLRCNGTCGDCEELEKVVDRLGEFEDKAEQQPVTNADRIRAMSDEELAEAIAKLYDMDDVAALANLFCDGKAGCIDAMGNVNCNDDRIKACIARWLQRPVGEDNHGET